MHSDKIQQVRTETLQKFKDVMIQILISTDIAARGLDITALPAVINYDLPHQTKDYVHRIGRTGHAGLNGMAISLVDAQAEKHYQSIMQLTDQQLPLATVSHYKPKWLSPSASQKYTLVNLKTTEQLRDYLHLTSIVNLSAFGTLATKRPFNQPLVRPTRCIRRPHKQANQGDCALLLPHYGVLEKY